jgi:hypothetical protein
MQIRDSRQAKEAALSRIQEKEEFARAKQVLIPKRTKPQAPSIVLGDELPPESLGLFEVGSLKYITPENLSIRYFSRSVLIHFRRRS